MLVQKRECKIAFDFDLTEKVLLIKLFYRIPVDALKKLRWQGKRFFFTEILVCGEVRDNLSQVQLARGRLSDEGNDVVPLPLLPQPSKDHLGARDVLLWVGEVLIQGLLVPGDALGLVCRGVVEALSLPRLPAHHAMQVGSHLVASAGLDGVTLPALHLEDLLALFRVAATHDYANKVNKLSESSRVWPRVFLCPKFFVTNSFPRSKSCKMKMKNGRVCSIDRSESYL